MAFEYLLPDRDQLTRFILVVVLSLALDAAVAQLFLYLGGWSPHRILLTLIGVCWLGVILEFLAKTFRRKSP